MFDVMAVVAVLLFGGCAVYVFQMAGDETEHK